MGEARKRPSREWLTSVCTPHCGSSCAFSYRKLMTFSSSYNHLITGAKSPHAKECPGGIIADEMGLGKSLTMLSAITGTLDRACTYAQSMTSIGSSGQGIIAAKSTLILVPSACTSKFCKIYTETNTRTVLIDSWVKEINE